MNDSRGTLRVGRTALFSTFLRSFAIQGSWNYQSMIGGGFAFALLPVLRRVYGNDGPELEEALARHSAHFNAHPYLAGVALGAVARLEEQGADPQTVARFKAAVRGPLGGVGDALVWAGWLPTTLVAALLLAWLGFGPLIAVLFFLALYNVGHVSLRAWGLLAGYRAGSHVGGRLREAHLSHRTEVVNRIGSVLLGALCGVVLTSELALGGSAIGWSVLAVASFATGLVGGLRLWRPTAAVVVGIVAMVLVSQAVR